VIVEFILLGFVIQVSCPLTEINLFRILKSLAVALCMNLDILSDHISLPILKVLSYSSFTLGNRRHDLYFRSDLGVFFGSSKERYVPFFCDFLTEMWELFKRGKLNVLLLNSCWELVARGAADNGPERPSDDCSGNRFEGLVVAMMLQESFAIPTELSLISLSEKQYDLFNRGELNVLLLDFLENDGRSSFRELVSRGAVNNGPERLSSGCTKDECEGLIVPMRLQESFAIPKESTLISLSK